MNAAVIHLAVNHAPLFLPLVAAALLVGALWQRNQSLLTAAIWLIVVAAVLAVVALQSGQAAEQLLEHVPGINTQAIEQHEDSAKMAVLATVISAGIGLGIVVGKRWSSGRFQWGAATILLLATLISIGIVGYTAHQGGLIRHAEELENRLPAVPATPDAE